MLFGGNFSGDIKLKPMLVYGSENLRALKNIKKMNYQYSGKVIKKHG